MKQTQDGTALTGALPPLLLSLTCLALSVAPSGVRWCQCGQLLTRQGGAVAVATGLIPPATDRPGDA